MRISDAERLDKVSAELAALKRALEVGASRTMLSAALRIINRHNLVNEFVDELSALPGRVAIAADLGIPE